MVQELICNMVLFLNSSPTLGNESLHALSLAKLQDNKNVNIQFLCLFRPRLAHEEALNPPGFDRFLCFSDLGKRDAIGYR